MLAAAGHAVAAVARVGRSAIVVMNRRLGDAVREIFEHVEPGDSLLRQQHRGARLRLLKNGRDQIADLRFLPLRALHVQHCRLERAAERRRLFGLALMTAGQRFDRVIEAVGDVSPKERQVGAARRENPLSVGIVRDRVQQVFERQICVAARDRLAEGDMKNDFDGRGKHQASSIVARNG